MNEFDKIYLDKKGYEKLLRDIEDIKTKLGDLRKNKSDAYENGGDGFHDNFAFEDSERNERMLIRTLAERTAFLEKVVIINSQTNDEIVDINDLVSLTIDFGDDIETNIYRLIGTADDASIDGIINVSLNSPLGKAIYGSRVGSDTKYNVENSTFLVHINEKVKEEKTKIR